MSMHQSRFARSVVFASLSLPILLIAGCSDDGTVTANPATVSMATGNWQISSSDAAAAHLSAISGEFTTQAGKITAIVHSQSASSCVAPSTSFELSGAADDKNVVTLTGALAKGTLTVSGTLAADGKSLTNATYGVSGGSCAIASKVQAVAQDFQPITGSYAGNFADADGQIAQVTANFSQSTTPDANGNFTLAGTAAVIGNPCFASAVPVSNTQVTGGTFSFTYGDSDNNVIASGTFSSDAQTLTVTSWTATGTCGADRGVQSTMTRSAH